MLIHYFQDNQSILEVSQIFLIQKEKSEIFQKQSCRPNSCCMWPLAVRTEAEHKGKIRSSTGKQIIAEPEMDKNHHLMTWQSLSASINTELNGILVSLQLLLLPPCPSSCFPLVPQLKLQSFMT